MSANVGYCLTTVKFYHVRLLLDSCGQMSYIVAMKDKAVKSTMRSEKIIKEKLSYISSAEHRNLSSQMEYFLTISIAEWEDENGPITFDKPR